jgi:hypothetical protein
MLTPKLLIALSLAVAPQSSSPSSQQAPPRKRATAEKPSAEKELKRKQAAFAAQAPDAGALAEARERAIGLLVSLQESMDPQVKEPCEWPYEGVYRVPDEKGQPQIPIGYRVGGTSIVCSALLCAQPDKLEPASEQAILRSLDFVLRSLKLPLMQPEGCKGYDVRGWGHAYALEFLLRLRASASLPTTRRGELDEAVRWLIAALGKLEHSESGGWNYARTDAPSGASPFMTAPTLQFLYMARDAGFTVPDALVERALATLEASRGESSAVQYATQADSPRGKSAEEIPAAVARMAVVETTLLLAGRSDEARIERAVESFFAHWEWLEVRRRQNGTHIPPYSIAPYYFFYGHRYVAQAIEFLPEGKRAAARERLYQLLWAVRESSGGWNDRVFPRSENFGTAMTLCALLEPARARPVGWSAKKSEKSAK